MSELTEKLIKDVTQRAAPLLDRYKDRLSKGEIPEDIDYQHLITWNNTISKSDMNLSTRVKLFKKHSASFQDSKSIHWIQFFESVIQSYPALELPGVSEIRLNPSAVILISPFIDVTQKKLQLIISNDYRHHQQIISELLVPLKNQMEYLAAPAFAEYYNSESGNNAGGLEEFRREFIKIKHIDFFQLYPVLARQLSEYCINYLEQVSFLFQRISNDSELLQKRNLINGNSPVLNSIKADLASLPNKSGTNFILQFENGNKLLYKSKSSANDYLYNEIVGFINTHSSFKLKQYHSLDRVAYSWHEFIEYSPCKHPSEFNEYYLALGFLAATAQLLSSSDYHYGNVIASGNSPILIDHESIYNVFDKKQEFSFKSACIIASNQIFDIKDQHQLLAAFHSEAKIQRSYLAISEEGNVKIEKKEQAWLGKNIPFTKDDKATPLDHIKDMIEGYIKGLVFFKNQSQAFLHYIKDIIEKSQLLFRYVPRASRTYFDLHHNLIQPNCLKDGIKFNLEIEKLFIDATPSKTTKSSMVHHYETMSLIRGLKPEFILNSKNEKNAAWSKLGYSECKHNFTKTLERNIQHISEQNIIENLVADLKNYLLVDRNFLRK